MGTSEYSVRVLSGLLQAKFPICGVISQPDRLKNRRGETLPTPIKTCSRKMGLNLFQPDSIRTSDFYRFLERMTLDMIVTAAYGKILSKRHLSIPTLGVLNVHASLLPALRGAAPAAWAVVRGLTTTGVTIMKTDTGLDSGPIISRRPIPVSRKDTAGSLEMKLAEAGADLLVETIPQYLSGSLVPVEQDHRSATYAPKLSTSDARIDWNRPAVEIERSIRGFNPNPGAFSFLRDIRIKVHLASVFSEGKDNKAPGTVLGKIDGKGFLIATGKGILLCLDIQPASRNIIRGDLLFQGRYVREGDRLKPEPS